MQSPATVESRHPMISPSTQADKSTKPSRHVNARKATLQASTDCRNLIQW
jgi:hypothetical protein